MAITNYNEVISLDENHTDAIFNRGSAKFSAKNSAEVCADFKRASNLGHSNAHSSLMRFCK